MESSVCVEQKGTVEQISSHSIRVRIHRVALCGDCHAKGMCFLGNENDKELEISNFTPGLKPGDHVDVILSQKSGNKAVMLAYFVPFLILITTLLILSTLGTRDWLAGIISLCALAPYFMILYFFKNRLSRSLTITARKN